MIGTTWAVPAAHQEAEGTKEPDMNNVPRAILVAMTLIALAANAPAAELSPDWMTDEGGVLELKLAHDDKDRPDGGLLRLDRNKRLLLWEGIPGDIGCKLKVEAKFEDVEAVRVGEQAGFTVELKKGKPKKLVLIPVPHAEWFLKQYGIREGLATAMANTGDLRGIDGDKMRPSGASASAGPSIKKVELPQEVVRDTRQAANAVLAAMDRLPPGR
jgi:hypothetical protein